MERSQLELAESAEPASRRTGLGDAGGGEPAESAEPAYAKQVEGSQLELAESAEPANALRRSRWSAAS